ncbi:MAG: twin-arginine translocase TatA/TatE family subunit [Chthoniobacterales bacterium]
MLALLSNLAGPDLFIVLLIILVLFGAKRLPELARGMGQAVKEFQKAKDDFTDELHRPGPPLEEVQVRPAAATTPRLAAAPPSLSEPAPHVPAASTAPNDPRDLA